MTAAGGVETVMLSHTLGQVERVIFLPWDSPDEGLDPRHKWLEGPVALYSYTQISTDALSMLVPST